MLPRTYITPDDHWAKSLGVPMSQAVRCGDLLVVSGQVAIGADGSVETPDDLIGQTRAVMASIRAVLADAGLAAGDLVQLRGFYVPEGGTGELAVEAEIAAALEPLNGPGPALTPVPVLRPAGVVVEIEAIAMRGQNGAALSRTAAWDATWPGPCRPFSHALRVGSMIFTSGVTAETHDGIPAAGDIAEQSHVMMRRLGGLLAQLGADYDDVVKSNVFNTDGGNAEAWAESALNRAGYYAEPGPAATGISVTSLLPAGVMTKKDVVAMRRPNGERMVRRHVWPDGHWDWTVHMPYRHGLQAGDLVFLGGQVPLNPDASVAHAGDIARQTEMSMEYIRRILADLGMDFANVLRLNAFFATGGARRSTRMRIARTWRHVSPIFRRPARRARRSRCRTSPTKPWTSRST